MPAKPALLLTLAALALSSVGCESTAPPAAEHERVSRSAYPKVTATGNLNDFLAFDEGLVERADNGAMTVTVPVRILRNKEVPVQYRFFFFDEQGRPLRPEMDWQYEVLPAKTQAFLTGTALDERATDWRLELRPART